jgi:hypothetical protein
VFPLATGGFGFEGPPIEGVGARVGTAVLVAGDVVAVAVAVLLADGAVAVDAGAVAVGVVVPSGVGVTMSTGTCVPLDWVEVPVAVPWPPPMTIAVGDTELPIADRAVAVPSPLLENQPVQVP